METHELKLLEILQKALENPESRINGAFSPKLHHMERILLPMWLVQVLGLYGATNRRRCW